VKRSPICLFLILIMVSFTLSRGFCSDMPGRILYEKDGALCSIQPDGRGNKVIVPDARGPVLPSPDGTRLAFVRDNQIFLVSGPEHTVSLLYQGQDDDGIFLMDWKTKSRGFFFRKFLDDGSQKIFLINDEEGLIKDLGLYHETPVLSHQGDFWVYSDYNPEDPDKKSEVWGGEPGEKGVYVFHGRVSQVLGWDKNSPAVMYFINDKIYGFELVSRARQIFNLPFDDVTVIAFGYPSILYFKNLSDEDEAGGLKLYDPERREQEDVIDGKKLFLRVASNKEDTRHIVFVPQRNNDPLGEGDLYFVNTSDATSTKLTKDIGRRVLLENNLSHNFSPCGKYFVYEKLRLRFSNIKRSELWIVGGEKETKLIDRAGHPVWIEDSEATQE